MPRAALQDARSRAETGTRENGCRWISGDRNADADIPGATGLSYTLTDAEDCR